MIHIINPRLENYRELSKDPQINVLWAQETDSDRNVTLPLTWAEQNKE